MADETNPKPLVPEQVSISLALEAAYIALGTEVLGGLPLAYDSDESISVASASMDLPTDPNYFNPN